MRLLLDTHAFLWWDSDPARLSAKALAACKDPTNVMILSVASIWEMQIKMQLGKLKLSVQLETTIASQRQANSLEVLPITMAHVLALNELPPRHRDPFDRLLIAQANTEGATLVSNDSIFESYPVRLLW
jgi:PIN domain nuclease of toxin-antitoxin system